MVTQNFREMPAGQGRRTAAAASAFASAAAVGREKEEFFKPNPEINSYLLQSSLVNTKF
jgi:hypothetical protein